MPAEPVPRDRAGGRPAYRADVWLVGPHAPVMERVPQARRAARAAAASAGPSGRRRQQYIALLASGGCQCFDLTGAGAVIALARRPGRSAMQVPTHGSLLVMRQRGQNADDRQSAAREKQAKAAVPAKPVDGIPDERISSQRATEVAEHSSKAGRRTRGVLGHELQRM